MAAVCSGCTHIRWRQNSWITAALYWLSRNCLKRFSWLEWKQHFTFCSHFLVPRIQYFSRLSPETARGSVRVASSLRMMWNQNFVIRVFHGCSTAVERSLNKIQQTFFSIFFWSASQKSSQKSSYLWGPWMPDRSHAPQPSKLASRSEGRAAGWASWRLFFWVRRHGYTKRAFPQHLWASTVAFGRLPFSIMSKLGRWRLWRCSKALAPMKAGN